MHPEPLWGRRSLEDVSVVGTQCAVTGWAFARDGGELERIEVETRPAGGGSFRSLELGDSHDVSAAFPNDAPPDRCRFRVVLSLEREATSDGMLFLLRPVFAGGAGRVWSVGHGLLSPPREFLDLVGGGRDVGLEFVDYFLDFAGLTVDDALLDLGCGTGRMAIPLQKILSRRGRYIGIDVDSRLTDWCKEKIQANDDRFQFRHVPVRNEMYNPGGRLDPATASLPVETAQASFAFATSVFTHLRASHAAHYLRELGRCVRVGGRLLMTAFLIDPAGTETSGRSSSSTLRFRRYDAETWTTDPRLPETAIGFAPATLERWASRGGLALERVLPGNWLARDDGYSYQDILIFVRR